MESVCAGISGELRARGLVKTGDPFMVAQVEELQAAIRDPFLLSLPPQVG